MLATSVPNDEFNQLTLRGGDELQVHVDVLDMLKGATNDGVSQPNQVTGQSRGDYPRTLHRVPLGPSTVTVRARMVTLTPSGTTNSSSL